MALEIPTKSTIRSAVLALWKSERPDADSTQYSDLWLFSRIMSVIVFRLHQTVERGIDAIFPTTSRDQYLDKWLRWIGAPDGSGGYGLVVPHISSASSALRCYASGGNVAAGALQNETLTDSAGRTYKITEANAQINDGNYEDLDLESVDTGTGTNILTGTTLTFVSPPANSANTADTVVDMTGGLDSEENSEGQARLLYRLQNPAMSGNVADYVTTIEDLYPGVLKAYVWVWRNEPQSGIPGYGTTDFLAFDTTQTGSDRYILNTDDIYDEISDEINTEMPPIGTVDEGQARHLTVSSQTADIEVKIELNPGATSTQQVDWDAESQRATVASHDAGGDDITASVNVCSPTVTDGLEVDDRVVIGGIEGTVTAVNVGGDAKVFTVDDWPWATGANALDGLNICAGGGLVGEITQGTTTGSGTYQAIQDYMDSLGPATGDYAAQGSILGWDDTIRVAGVQYAVIDDGDGTIIDCDVEDIGGGGSADLAPTAGTGATIQAYSYDEISVWQEWLS